ncbi:hypothetical protein [Arthrobacter sp. CJ23]|uniref:hypothetical protein n=1 Tax=Arthrobacter sp. CJ23 TaxID=2972479 RepID=UPI00215C0998|nr:hypothetical protein [Arthrobacter sp. CJ23]UVJ40129.1 hypothetical protein NVV90_02755 [Arthrobacter sp. CJ23]
MNNPDNAKESETVLRMPEAPPIEAEIPSYESASTSRALWITAYVVVMVLVALRLPLINQNLTSQVPADVRSELGDDRLLSLSMTVGTVLFFLLYAVIMCLFFSLAGVLDKRVIPGKTVIGGRWKIGAFFVVAVLATVPLNLVSVVFGLVQPRELPGYWLYFPAVALAVLFFFRRHWVGFSLSRLVLTVLSAVGLSTVVSLG